jgi:MSHA type pilus biogenesis protein MshL
MRKSELTRGILPLLFAFLLLCGCASNLAQKDVNEAMTRIEESDQTAPPIPPELSFSPVVEIRPEREKLFSFSGRGIPLEDVLDALSKQAGFSVMWDREVNRRTQVTVTFEDLTLSEALDAIFAPTEYLYSTLSPTLHVKLTDTRIFELGQVPTKTRSQMQVGGDVLGSIPNVGGMSGQFQIIGLTDEEAVDFWKQVEEALEKIISREGKYFINRLACIVTVTDRKKNLKIAEEFVANLRSSLSRQVLIEAEVVEVTLERAESWGVDWSAVHSFIADNRNIDLTATQTLGLPGSVVEFTASRHDANLVLDMLARYGEVNVLSKPRLNVMNGQTAMINVGRVISYWELTGLAAGAQIGQPVIFPEQKTVLLGLTMGVTPYISSDGYVTLQVTPIVSDASSFSEFQFENQTLRAPNIDIKETSTQVRMKNGETVVIGGLITSRKTDTEHKIPLLGDLPLLGFLFKRKEKVEQRAELVILLTPRISNIDREGG